MFGGALPKVIVFNLGEAPQTLYTKHQTLNLPFFFGKKIEQCGQCKPQVALRFQAVVQYDDRAGPAVADDIIQAFLRLDTLVEVAAQHVPHHNPVVLFQRFGLCRPESAVWRTKKIALHQTGALRYVVQVICNRRLPAVEVLMGVVADRVAFVFDALKNSRMALYVFTYTKKGSPGFVLL